MYCRSPFFFSSGTNRERNGVVAKAVENLDQRFGQSDGSVTNRSYGSSLLQLEQPVEEACALVERVSREREIAEFGWEIERKEHEIRTERARKKRGREERQLPEVSIWPQQPFHALLCNFSEQCGEVS